MAKQLITITVEVQEPEPHKARRLGTTLESIVIEAMALTGRRGFSVGMGVDGVEEATP